MECCRLYHYARQQMDMLKILSVEWGSATDNIAPCIGDNGSKSSDDTVVLLHHPSPVVHGTLR
jgi:hypothetical protein